MSPNGNTSYPCRVITKVNGSGTAVTKVFDINGVNAKELVGKNGTTVSFKGSLPSPSGIESLTVSNNGNGYYKPMHVPSNEGFTLPSGTVPNTSFLNSYLGITQHANAGNADYETLKKLGMIAQ